MLKRTGEYTVESERDWSMYCNTPRDRGILSCITTVKDKEWSDHDAGLIRYTYYVEVREYAMPNGRVQPRAYQEAKAPPPTPYHEYLPEWDDWFG
jgi:hypothetical protein